MKIEYSAKIPVKRELFNTVWDLFKQNSSGKIAEDHNAKQWDVINIIKEGVKQEWITRAEYKEVANLKKKLSGQTRGNINHSNQINVHKDSLEWIKNNWKTHTNTQISRKLFFTTAQVTKLVKYCIELGFIDAKEYEEVSKKRKQSYHIRRF